MTPPKQLLLEVTIAAPVDDVWRAVREPEQLKNWFGWDADSLDEEIALIFGKPASLDERERTITFAEWEGISDGFELVERDGRTVLRVVRFGGVAQDWDEVYDEVFEGWAAFVAQLRLLLERHPRGAKRRTIFLSGPLREGARAPTEALGLAGEARAIAIPVGAGVTGERWSSTGFAVGVRVDAWGDGLLIATDKPPADARPHGGGSILITTFGLDDAAFTALERAWSEWWSAIAAA